jgi:hypothetical protein
LSAHAALNLSAEFFNREAGDWQGRRRGFVPEPI